MRGGWRGSYTPRTTEKEMGINTLISGETQIKCMTLPCHKATCGTGYHLYFIQYL